MKTKLLKILILVLFASVSLFIASCKNEDTSKNGCGCGKESSQSESLSAEESKSESKYETVVSTSESLSQGESQSLEESDSGTKPETESESLAESELVRESESQAESESASEVESESESVHVCDYTELKYSTTHHWYECSCGEKDGRGVHSGGTASCSQKAICEVCNQAYGDFLEHEYEIKYDATYHWYECSCGETTEAVRHTGGSAECKQKAECEICGQEYGSFEDHTFGTLKTDGESHWYECSCGEKDGVEKHAYNTLKTNATHHWYECKCGEKAQEGAHDGGTATCTEKAVCETCNEAYGELLEHEYELKYNEDYHWYECNCGEKTQELEHENEEFLAQAPTCEEIGWHDYVTCTECGYTTYEEIPALGHDWKTEELQALSCTKDGIYNLTCTRENCGQEKTSVEKTKGHTYGEWAIVSNATCYQNGLEKQVCSTCLHEEQIITNALEHFYIAVNRTVEDGVEKVTYECEHCHDKKQVESDVAIEDVTKSEYLYDLAPDFTFNIIGGKSEDYVRQNVFFINALFQGTENETKPEAQVLYNLTDLGDGKWQVAPQTPYEAGMTYFVKIRGTLSFADYGGKELTFKIAKQESSVAELSSNVKFLKTLESENPGYYPYEVEISEDAGVLWLTVGKIDGLEKGNIICIGDVESKEELLAVTDGDVYFGKIEEIYVKPDGTFLIANSCPEMSEVFEELDISLEQDVNFEEDGVDIRDDIQEQAERALFANDDFLNFAGTMQVAAKGYLLERNLNANVFAKKNILDLIEIKCEPKIEGEKITIHIDGTMTVPMEYDKKEETEKIGNIIISFTLDIEASFWITCDYKILSFGWIPISVDYIDVQLHRTTMVDFSFKLSIDVSYELMEDREEKPYVLNTQSLVLHQKKCKHEESIKDKSKLTELTSEDALKKYLHGECIPCGTCRPISRMTATEFVINLNTDKVHVPDCPHIGDEISGSYELSSLSFKKLEKQGYEACLDCKPNNREDFSFQEHLKSKVVASDVAECVSSLKNVLGDTSAKEEEKKGIEIANIPIYICYVQVNVKVRVNFSFKFEATITYDYKITSNGVYGIRYSSGRVYAYSSEDSEEEENKLEIIGKLSIRAGLSVDISAGVTGLTWLASVGIETEVGVYAKANGVVSIDAVANEIFAGVYFEAGIYLDVDAYLKLLTWKPTLNVYDNEWPLYRFGVDKAYYSYVEKIDEINTDSDFTLSEELLNVKYFDVQAMEASTETLKIAGVEGLYTVDFTLKDGSYCYVENGVIKIKDDAPGKFTDVLYVCVTSLTELDKYVKGSCVFYLGEYAITINYESFDHRWVEIDRLDPTCLEEGFAEYECTNPDCLKCNGTPMIKKDVLHALGHVVVTEEMLAPTCENDGYTERKYCSVCSDVLLEKFVLYAIGHDLLLHEGKSPTCATIGWDAYYTCFNEGCTYTTYYEYKLPHSWNEDGKCVVCGQEGSEGLSFTPSGDGYAVSKGTCTDTNVVIPSYYNGLPVITVHSNAFSNYVNLTTVEIPNTVTSIDSTAFRGCTSLTSVVIGDSVTTIGSSAFQNCSSLTSMVIPDSVTNIGSYAFRGCTSLISVVIGDSVTTIGSYAFYDCTSLTSIEIPNTVTSIDSYVFYNCISLADVKIPDSVTSIGVVAFAYCTSLTNIVIPDSVTNIFANSFDGCENLVRITMPSSIISVIPKTKFQEVKITSGEIPYKAFSNCVNLVTVKISDSVTIIGESAFNNCKSLTSVEIGNSVTSIGDSAFYGCTSLTSVEIPNSIASLGDYAFYGCTSLTSIDIPDSIASLGGYAFSNCTSLTSIDIPDSVTSIGHSAFSNCTSLTSVEIPDSVTSIGDYTFNGCISLTGIVIGGNITSIGHYSFYECASLISVVIGESAKNVGNYAFYGCTSLTSVVIGDSVTTIGSYAFYDCISLTSVEIGDKVAIISGKAFAKCSSLTSIEMPSSVTSIGSEAFAGCSNLQNMTLPFVGSSKGATSASEKTLFGYIFGKNSYNGSVAVEQHYSIGKSVRYYIPTSLTTVKILGGKILFGAFECCDNLTSVVIGDGVPYIERDAFNGCSSLSYVEIGENVTDIGFFAFHGCTNLTSIEIPANVKNIEACAFEYCYRLVEVINKSSYITVEKGKTSNGYVGYYALRVSNRNNNYVSKITNDNGYIIYADDEEIILLDYDGNETDLLIPESITQIYAYAFSNCTSLTSIKIGGNVTSIGQYAFSSCTSLISVEISASVTYIVENAFGWCTSLVNIEVHDGNAAYKSIDGDLYTKDGTILIQYAIGKSKTEFIIPNGVTSVDMYAFDNCDNLTSVVISESVTNIESHAFNVCSNLKCVYYLGDESDWEKISIGSYNTSLFNATKYYYSEGEPTESGNYWHYDENGNPVAW